MWLGCRLPRSLASYRKKRPFALTFSRCLGSGRIFDHGKPSHTGKPAGPLSLCGDGLLGRHRRSCHASPRGTLRRLLDLPPELNRLLSMRCCSLVLTYYFRWPRSKLKTFRICLGNTSAKPH
jgi:hypothetical protein